jgi:hypothetical protein
MKRRIFLAPVMREAAGDPVVNIARENLIRGPALLTRKPVPDPDPVEDQAEEDDEQDSCSLFRVLRRCWLGNLGDPIDITIGESLSSCPVRFLEVDIFLKLRAKYPRR